MAESEFFGAGPYLHMTAVLIHVAQMIQMTQQRAEGDVRGVNERDEQNRNSQNNRFGAIYTEHGHLTIALRLTIKLKGSCYSRRCVRWGCPIKHIV
jgi:hypothetical protein